MAEKSKLTFVDLFAGCGGGGLSLGMGQTGFTPVFANRVFGLQA